jgi:hypothetical protein
MSHLPLLVIATVILWACFHNGGPNAEPYYRDAPATAPTRPLDASGDAEWLLLPFQAIASLAGLCWLLVCLAVFLAPLAFVVLLVLGLVMR